MAPDACPERIDDRLVLTPKEGTTMSSESVTTQHPLYNKHAPDWELVRDAAEGEREVKSKGQIYLPATSGMIAKGMTNANQPGWKMYQAYKMRAVFPDLVRPAVNALVGIMHREPADIKLPSGMEDIRDNATLEGESLQTLLRRVNEAQLLIGRIGLLADVPTGQVDALPFIATYEAEAIVNWDESRRPDGRLRPDFVVLDESDHERVSTFGWEFVQKHLVLDLVDPTTLQDTRTSEVPLPPGQRSVYRSRLEIGDQSLKNAEETNRQTEVTAQGSQNVTGVTPEIRGKRLEEIPFVFVGSIDLTTKPDQVPMLGLANLAFTIYRGEADYRHSLFMQGQDTLVVIGDTQSEDGSGAKKDRLIGANASLDLPVGGDAKYIGVASDGLTEQRESLQNDRNRAAELGANLLSSSKGAGKEAEETLRIRVAARTASILTIVKAGAEGLQTILRVIAEWRGLNPEDVVVTANMDFVGDKFSPKDLVDFMTAKNMGAPVSRQTIHDFMSDKDVTAKTLEEELQLIEDEEPMKGEPDPEAEEQRRQEDLEFMRANLQLQNGGPGGPGAPGQEGPARNADEGDGEGGTDASRNRQPVGANASN
jgi:hypothetical protein